MLLNEQINQNTHKNIGKVQNNIYLGKLHYLVFSFWVLQNVEKKNKINFFVS